MAVNKVVYGGDTLIDLSADTVTPETLRQGTTAHGANGERITGTAASSVSGEVLTVAFGTAGEEVLYA